MKSRHAQCAHHLPLLLLFMSLGNVAATQHAYANPESYNLQLGDVEVTASRPTEETVESVSKVEIQAIPASIISISSQTIADQNAANMTDVLKNAAGLQPTDGGMANDFRARGLGVTFFRDGLFDGNAQNSYYRSLVDIEEIEVLKGANSTLLGSSAPGASINLITKKPSHTPQTVWQASVGSFATRNLSVDTTGEIQDNIAGRLIINTEKSNGYRGLGRELHEFLPSLTMDLADNRKLLLDIDYRRSSMTPDNYGIPFNFQRKIADVNIENRYYTPFVDVDQTVVRSSISQEWLISDAVQMNTTFSYDTRDLDILRNVRGNAENAAGRLIRRSLRQQFDDADYINLQNSWLIFTHTGTVEHQITTGVSYANTRIGTLRNGYQLPSINDIENPVMSETALTGLTRDQSRSFDRKIKSDNAAVFFNDQMTFDPQWKMRIGMRNEQVSASDKGVEGTLGYREVRYHKNLFSGQVGLVYQPQSNISVYGNISQGAFNNINTKVSQISPQPEKSKQLEIGSKLTLLQNKLSLDAAWFHIKRENYLFDLPEAESTSDGKDVSKGIELQFQYRPNDAWQLRANAVWIDPKVETDVLASLNALNITDVSVKGTEPVGVSRRVYNLWGQYAFRQDFLQGFALGLGATYRSETYADPLNQYQVPAFLVFDANIHYKAKNWSANLGIKNLTNKEYFTTTTNIGAVPGDERSAFLNVTFLH